MKAWPPSKNTLADYIAKGMTDEKIAALFGKGKKAVWHLRRKLKLGAAHAAHRPRHQKATPEQKRERAAFMREALAKPAPLLPGTMESVDAFLARGRTDHALRAGLCGGVGAVSLRENIHGKAGLRNDRCVAR